MLKWLIDDFFKEICYLQGLNFNLIHIFDNYGEQMKSEQKNPIPHLDEFPYHASGLLIRDLTGESSNGFSSRYYTNTSYIIDKDNYGARAQDLGFKVTSFIMLQSYERFESFLKAAVLYALCKKPDLTKAIPNLDLEDRLYNEYEMRDLIAAYKSSGYNNYKKYFYILRKISEDFKSWSIKNNDRINLTQWYKVYSEVRHCITHSDSRISKAKIKSFGVNEQLIFENYFSYSIFPDHYHICLHKKSLNRLLETTAEFAFLIFKALAILLDEDWKILKDMKLRI